MTLKQEIGQQLVKLREKLGITQDGMAKRMGTTRQYISMVEKGSQSISLDQVEKFSRALGATVEIKLVVPEDVPVEAQTG